MSTTSKSPSKKLRYVSLKSQLERLIQQSQPGSLLPSYTEMIRRYKVGQSTIDRVLRDFDDAGLIVRKPGKGIFISEHSRNKTIGFVLGRNIFRTGNSPICTILLEHCQKRATHGQENFKFYIDLPNMNAALDAPLHQELAEDIQSGRLNGVILVWSYGPEQTRWIRSQQIPVVSMGAEDDLDSHGAIIDYAYLVRLGVEELARQGRKNIALLSPFGHLRAHGYNTDINSFKKSLSHCGLKYNEKWILQDRSDLSMNAGGRMSNEELGFQIMRTFLSEIRESKSGAKRKLPIDGLVSEDDMMTRGALAALRQESKDPRDLLRIATHTNKGSPVLNGESDQLIHLEIDPEDLVEAMFSLLEPMMEGQTPSSPKIHIRPKLH